MRVLITGGNGNIAKMIRNNLSFKYEIVAPARAELNILSFSEVKYFLENNDFDILVHTAISGGRRTKDENGDVTHFNLLMWENILKFADRFKMIINLDSGAIYDRSTDILNRSEDDIFTVPNDYYGFSKYLIYQRSLQYKNVFNFRIFNAGIKSASPEISTQTSHLFSITDKSIISTAIFTSIPFSFLLISAKSKKLASTNFLQLSHKSRSLIV